MQLETVIMGGNGGRLMKEVIPFGGNDVSDPQICEGGNQPLLISPEDKMFP